MNHNFTLKDFPNFTFTLQKNIWTGKTKLLMDNKELEQSKEKGKPFLIPSSNGNYVKAYPKHCFPIQYLLWK